MQEKVTHIDVGDLPESLQDLVEMIGFGPTLTLAQVWGGSHLPVLSNVPDEHPLVRKLGRQVVEALARYYGSERPHIPRAAKALREVRNRMIRAEYDAGGVSGDFLARKYSVGCVMIWKILGMKSKKKSSVNERQMSFKFD